MALWQLDLHRPDPRARPHLRDDTPSPRVAHEARRPRFSVCIAAAACIAVLGALPARRAGGAIQHTAAYIVTLVDSADPGTVEQSVGADATHVYRSALSGFAASMTDAQV